MSECGWGVYRWSVIDLASCWAWIFQGLVAWCKGFGHIVPRPWVVLVSNIHYTPLGEEEAIKNTRNHQKSFKDRQERTGWERVCCLWGEGSIDRTVRTLCLLKTDHGGIWIIQRAHTPWGLIRHQIWRFPPVKTKEERREFELVWKPKEFDIQRIQYCSVRGNHMNTWADCESDFMNNKWLTCNQSEKWSMWQRQRSINKTHPNWRAVESESQ